MANNILKEAIADAKAVREVALANAKAALEEAFTPKLQSMLSAKLSEDLDEAEEMEEMGYGMEEADDMEETYDMEEADDMEEITGMENEAEDMEENLDEEIDLEEILNELELEEGEEANEEKAKDIEEDMYEAKDEVEEEKLDEMGRPIYKAEDANYTGYTADRVHEGEEFNLDALLEEINNLDEEKEDTNEEEVNEGDFGEAKEEMDENILAKAFKGIQDFATFFNSGVFPTDKTLSNALFQLIPGGKNAVKSFAEFGQKAQELGAAKEIYADDSRWRQFFETGAAPRRESVNPLAAELEETKAALDTVTTELNEVNLLNSKLLYVNRIFKANTLDEGQKLRVVETLDKAETAKEAKLIYETIKDTFNVAKSKKASFKNKTKSLKEGIGMASRAAGTSTAPKKEVISESNDMMKRFQKLANIKIN